MTLFLKGKIQSHGVFFVFHSSKSPYFTPVIAFPVEIDCLF